MALNVRDCANVDFVEIGRKEHPVVIADVALVKIKARKPVLTC